MHARSFRWWLPLAVSIPLVVYLGYPLLALLWEGAATPISAFRAKQMGWDPSAQPSSAGLRFALQDVSTRAALWGTLKLTAVTVLFGGAWGLGLALLWGRREFPGRRIFALCGYAPLLMPPLVGTLAFYRLLGPAGFAWSWLPQGWRPDPFWAVTLLHVYSFGVFTFTFALAALEGLDAAHEEAARNLGANAWGTFRTAVWPALRAPLLAAALLTYMASNASFSGPYILDTSGSYLTVEIASEHTDDWGLATGLTIVLALLSLAALPPFLYMQRLAPGGPEAAAGLKGAAGRALTPATKSGALARIFLSLLVAVPLLAPPCIVIAGAFLDPRVWTEHGIALAPSFEGFRALQPENWAALIRSAGYGAAAAFSCIAIALLFALSLRRAPRWAAFPGEAAVMLAIALPGSVVAIALLTAFNAPSWLTGGVGLGGTGAILILAYAIRTLPLAVRPVRAAVNAGGDLERAAQGLGAGAARTLLRITLPLLLPTLIAAGLLCFVTAAGEYVASELLYSPQSMPVSKAIEMLNRSNATITAASALSMCLMGLSLLAIALGSWLTARQSWRAPK